MIGTVFFLLGMALFTTLVLVNRPKFTAECRECGITVKHCGPELQFHEDLDGAGWADSICDKCWQRHAEDPQYQENDKILP